MMRSLLDARWMKSEAAEAVALGLGLFVLYAAGACRTIYVGDSGELVTAVYLLGIPHPSGYPLYALLGKLWTLIVPFGSIAFRMSLFSAACAAATCGVVYRLGLRLALSRPAALTSALLLAFAPSFWSQANIQRVYTLNALFVALASAAAISWYLRRDEGLAERYLVLAFFSSGLGATNHTFMVVYGMALAAFVLLTQPNFLKRPRALFLGAGAFAVGLLPYLYLPIRSAANPGLDWGNPETLSSFLDVILRHDFWDRSWIESPADFLIIGADYAKSLGSELFWAGTALAVIGAIAGRRHRWPVLLPLLVIAANFASMALHGSRSDIFIWHRYYIPSYLMAALLAGMGLQVLLDRIALPRKLHGLCLAIPAIMLVMGWPKFDRSRYRIAEDFSRTLLETLPPGASLAANDDNILFVLIYLHFVEGLRPDMNLILQGVGDADLPPLRFNPDRDPLFLTHHPNWSIRGLEIVPVGLFFQTARSESPLPEPKIPKTELEGEKDLRVPKDYLTRNLIGHFHYMLGITFEPRDWPRAWHQMQEAQQAAPENDVLFYNLGLIYRRNGLFEESLEAFERSQAINPRHIASRSRARASERIGEVHGELDRLRPIEQRLGRKLMAENLTPGEPPYLLGMARDLENEGESLAARGYWLRAQVRQQAESIESR